MECHHRSRKITSGRSSGQMMGKNLVKTVFLDPEEKNVSEKLSSWFLMRKSTVTKILPTSI
jgi:hypothetical protein